MDSKGGEGWKVIIFQVLHYAAEYTYLVFVSLLIMLGQYFHAYVCVYTPQNQFENPLIEDS